jgi:beta-aspartyl-peptidase (threonine type)
MLLTDTATAQVSFKGFALAIHGGAGSASRQRLSKAQDSLYRASLHKALDLGERLLRSGTSAADVAVAVVALLEDDSLFNAGKGAVQTFDGTYALDAALMDGASGKAGAVTGVSIVKNPIKLAQAVMTNSPHVLLSGIGAEQFAVLQGIDTVPNTYFALQQKVVKAPKPKGTVGAVVLDLRGNLAAATSTGGMSGKRWGRVGDSPLIGAGTFADNTTAAVSCTGHGEFFIRQVVAYDLIARIKYAGKSIYTAADTIVYKELSDLGALGGLIALDRFGNIAMPFNTDGMYRGFIYSNGKRGVSIYRDEPISAQP